MARPFDIPASFVGVRLIPEKVRGASFVINLKISDRGEDLTLTLSRGCLTRLAGKSDPGAATVTLSHAAIARLAVGASMLDTEELSIDGDRSSVETLFAALDEFLPMFNVVTP